MSTLPNRTFILQEQGRLSWELIWGLHSGQCLVQQMAVLLLPGPRQLLDVRLQNKDTSTNAKCRAFFLQKKQYYMEMTLVPWKLHGNDIAWATLSV